MTNNRYFKCRKDTFVHMEKLDKLWDNHTFQGCVHNLRTYPIYKQWNMVVNTFLHVRSNLEP